MSKVKANSTPIPPEIHALDESEQESILKIRRLYSDKGLRNLRQRIITLLKSNPNPDPQDPEYQSLQSHLSLELQSYNLSLNKTLKIIQKISPEEISSYDQESQETDLEISKTLSEIELLKLELKDEERKRMDKLKYDEISREIEKLDSREKLDESIHKLQQSIRDLEAENSRYTELATSSRSRFEEMASNIFKLSIEIGEEVGERKRRDVDKEREVGEEMEEDLLLENDEEKEKNVEFDENGEKIKSSPSITEGQLNPTAKVFKPNSRRELEEGEDQSSITTISSKIDSNINSRFSRNNKEGVEMNSEIPKQLAGQKRNRMLTSSTREEGEASDGEEGEASDREEGEAEISLKEGEEVDGVGKSNVDEGFLAFKNSGRYVAGNVSGTGNRNSGVIGSSSDVDSGLPPSKRRK